MAERKRGVPGGAGLDGLLGAQRDAFVTRYGVLPTIVASAPGRINVIGEHTDYNRGLALPGAIDRWVVAALSPRADDVVRVYSEALDETLEARLADAGSQRGWRRLPMGAAALLGDAAGMARGFDAVIGGNVPPGAGISSSAAVEVALLNGLRAAFGIDLGDLALVLLAQRVEHEYLGVRTGLMDQYTSQFGRAGTLLLVDFEDLGHEGVDVRLDDWVWLLLDSGVRHELAESAYGERVVQMLEALRVVSAADHAVSSFRDLTADHVDAIEDPVLRRRARHYVGENERVRGAAAAVSAGDAAGLGTLLLQSHASLRDDYEVSCEELDALVDAAAPLDGCAGARMMGGGFGGCTLNLVRAEAVDELAAAVRSDFESRFGDAPGAAVYRLVGGARVHGGR